MSPRPFSTEEKTLVRQKLIDAAQEYMSTTGIRKTSVEDLCRAAGISKGAFYSFYDSKELVFMDALDAVQQRIHDTIIRELHAHPSKREGFVSATLRMYQDFMNKPWLLALTESEYEILLRRIPKARIDKHIALDDASSKRLIDELGGGIKVDPQLISAVLRMLFMTILHRQEIGEYADKAFHFMLQAVASALFSEEN
ncbi:MAG: TetR/AcrR family transcriptional regulator [Eubacteriales bacterium]|nr:TetR/AcrR family transcriptional regulator [Eubacteriales bacterium]